MYLPRRRGQSEAGRSQHLSGRETSGDVFVMLIHLLAEAPSKVAPIRGIVEPVHRLVPIDIDDRTTFTPDDVLIIDFDLRNEASVTRVREFLRQAGKIRHKIFV